MHRLLSFPFLLLVLLVGLSAGATYGFQQVTKASPLSTNFIEEDPPRITWKDPPKGLGADPVRLVFSVEDPGAGIDEVIVRVNRKNQVQEIFREAYDDAPRNKEFSVPIDPGILGLKVGDVTLEVTSFDRTLWSNAAQASLTLPVDFTRPRIEVLSPQQNATAGGFELVFYRVIGKEVVSQGVRAGKELHPGLPAAVLDPSFKSYPNLFVSLFPIPTSGKPEFEIVATDAFRNTARAAFNYRVRKVTFGSSEWSLPEEFKKIKEAELGGIGETPAPLAEIITRRYEQGEERLRKILSEWSPTKLWKGTLSRPVPGTVKAFFGETKVLTIGGEKVARLPLTGVHFAAVPGSKVVAAYPGIVKASEPIGIYGTAVVLDHGYGVATLYGFLSEATIDVGIEVSAGEQIGVSGASGLGSGDRIHFEVRLHNTPVNPNEWWDAGWMNDHFVQKIESVKRTLIGAPGE